MASIIDFKCNFSFYTIPAAWFLALAPRLYAITVYESSSSKKFDGRSPRTFIAQCEGDQSIDSATKRKVIRAEAAHFNGLENIGLFAAAVTAGNFAGLDNQLLNYLSAGYLASRIAYNTVYIHGDTAQLAMARTGIFMTGIIIIMSIFVMSGNEMRNGITRNLIQ